MVKWKKYKFSKVYLAILEEANKKSKTLYMKL